MQEFQDILKAKRDYYGDTEAAIHLAAEEYARQYFQESLKEEWHMSVQSKINLCTRWALESKELAETIKKLASE